MWISGSLFGQLRKVFQMVNEIHCEKQMGHKVHFIPLFIKLCAWRKSYSPMARIRHFEESLDLKIIWIVVLPNGSIISFQNQWPYKWCMRCVTYLAASSRLFLMKTRFSPQMADRAMGEYLVYWHTIELFISKSGRPKNSTLC